MEYLKEQVGFLIAMGIGLLVSVISADKHSLKIAGARLLAGLLCAVFGTDPLVDIMEWDPMIYRNASAGILAMSGYAITKFIVNAEVKNVIEIIKTIRGGK